MEILALAFSDLHLHRWKAHSEKDSRMYASLGILKTVRKKALELKVPLLFTGDLVHNEKAIENKLLAGLAMVLQEDGTLMYGISGNHDMSEKNTIDHISPSYVQTLSNIFPRAIYCLDKKCVELGKIKLFGIPFYNGNIGFRKEIRRFIREINPGSFNILMLHTDLPGATDAFGHIIDEVENIKTKYFKHFDLVIDGHIHKPQRFSKNTWILGAPYQQTRSEKGLDLGYWEIYRDHKPKLVKLDLPKFIDIEEGEDIPEDGNFYTVVPKPREFVTGKKFDAKLDRVKLAKKYLKHTEVKEKHYRKALLKILNTTE